MFPDVQMETAKHQGLQTVRFILKQIFVSGLREDVRAKVMEADVDTIEKHCRMPET